MFAECKPLHSCLSSTHYSHDGEEPLLYDEVESLGERIVAHNSPGAAIVVKNMQSIDCALMQLYNDLDRFNPNEHHYLYAADTDTRRYIFAKSFIDLSLLEHVASEIKKRIKGFHLTHANTQPAPKPSWAAAAEAWKHRHQDEMAREARTDRSAQRRISARKRAAAASSTRVVEPSRETKASTPA